MLSHHSPAQPPLALRATAPLLAHSRPFKGGADSPLLAPRGVCTVGGRLLVSDTGQNRVFLWRQWPEGMHAPPDVVLGQAQKTDTGRNADGAASASSLMYPSGLWSDGQRLIVADAWNHRVLIWQQWPEHDGQPADVVLGQPDFAQNAPNVAGIGQPPTARSLYWPYGLCSDGERLWVADTGNRRVLYYERIPTQSYAPADALIGQASFAERDYAPGAAVWPYSVKRQPGGKALAIVDTQYYRVLLWHDWERAFSQAADAIIGQPDFEANGQNQYSYRPSAQSLNWCYDAGFYGEGLWVADTGNSRLLWFERLPKGHNAAAQAALGQADFQTGSENAATQFGTEDGLYWPFHLSTEGRRLALADTGNHRIVLGELAF